MRKTLFFILFPLSVFAQVTHPHNSPSVGASERVANFTVSGAGNDRLEIANGTQNDGRFIPTFWSFRDTDNTFSMVFTSSIANSALDNGVSPLMLFTTTIAPQANFNSPGNGVPFVWGPAGTYQPISNRPLFEWRNSSEKLMTIAASGNVGIGTNEPTAKLHVVNSVRFQNLANRANPNFILGTDAEGNVFEYPVTSTGGGEAIADADWLKLDGTLAMSIDDDIYTNGKVGINIKKLPTHVGREDVSFYNLFVTGGILTEEVRISLVPEWADYVFKKDYKLATLDEVEQHINEKGHLKNIPSEAEVKQNGVELGEMNKLLLEKVEELTLYVIGMNKKIEEQQKEIDALKSCKK